MLERRTWISRGMVALALALCALLVFPGAYLSGEASSLQAATAPTLGQAKSFAVLGGSAVTNTGATIVNGDLGVSPGTSVTGFPPGIVNGTKHITDAVAAQAHSDTTTAYNNLAGQTPFTDMTGQDLGGKTLTAGVYKFTSSAGLTGTLTLNAQGKADAVFVFQIGSTLTTASNSRVLMTNGGSSCNVFWQVGSSATLGTTTSFLGNILALTSITLNTGAHVSGRALARNGAVTMDDNTISGSACGAGGTPATATPLPATKTAVAAKTATAGATKTAVARATKTAVAAKTATARAANAAAATATKTPTPSAAELPRTGEGPAGDVLWIGLLVGAVMLVGGLGVRLSLAARKSLQ